MMQKAAILRGLCLALLAAAAALAQTVAAGARAVVGSDTLPVYASMSETAEVKATLVKGDAVIIGLVLFGENITWCAISRPGQTRRLGFASCEFMEPDRGPAGSAEAAPAPPPSKPKPVPVPIREVASPPITIREVPSPAPLQQAALPDPKPAAAAPLPATAIPDSAPASLPPTTAVPGPVPAAPPPTVVVRAPAPADPPPTTAVPNPAPAAPTTAVPDPVPAARPPTVVVRDPAPAAPTPTTAVPDPVPAAPPPTTAVPDPVPAAPTPTTAVPDPVPAAPPPTTAVPDPVPAAPPPTTAVPEPAPAAPPPTAVVGNPAPAAPTTAVPDPAPAAPPPTVALPDPAPAAPPTRTAVPEPAPVREPEPAAIGQSDFVEVLLDGSGLRSSLANYTHSTHLLSFLDKGRLAEIELPTLERVLAEWFQPGAFYVAIGGQVRQNYSLDRVPAVAEWLRAPLTTKLASLERRAFSPDAHQELVTFAGGLSAAPPTQPRLILIHRLYDSLRTCDMEVETTIALVHTIAQAIGPALPKEKRYSATELDRALGAVKSRYRSIMKNARIVHYLFAYQSVSDEELEQYVNFLESASGKWLISLVDKGFFDATGSISRGLRADIPRTVKPKRRLPAENTAKGLLP